MMARRPRLMAPRRLLALLVLWALLVLPAVRSAIFRYYPYRHRTDIARLASQYQFDPYLIAAVVHTESKFVAGATSQRGARGLMQVMPETGRWAASNLGLEKYEDDRLYDPPTNLLIGTWYLAELRREFEGDMILALAAYNGGRRNVKDWLASNQWNGEHQNLNQIPFRETRDFVQRVLIDYRRYVWLYDGRGRWLTGDWPFWPAPQ